MDTSVTRLTKKLLPVAAAVALAFTGSAQATDLPLTIGFTGSLVVTGGTGTFTSILSPDVLTFGSDRDPVADALVALDPVAYSGFTGLSLPAGNFNFLDFYGFTVDPSESVGLAFGINLGGDHNLSSLHARVLALTGSIPMIVAESVDSNDGFFLSSVLEPYKLTTSPVGIYILEVTGNAAGTSSSSYSGQLSFVPAPVPVPAAVWLLGSALTSVVVAGRRKTAA